MARPDSLDSARRTHSGGNDPSSPARRGAHTSIHSGFGRVVVRNAVAGAVSPVSRPDCSFLVDQSFDWSPEPLGLASNVPVAARTAVCTDCSSAGVCADLRGRTEQPTGTLQISSRPRTIRNPRRETGRLSALLLRSGFQGA